MRNAVVVTGLGYGDEGKGSVTDALVRNLGAKLVVRYNGGPQAAHHVVCDDGRWHSFHQFGAGALAGARTHLSRFMLVDPFALQREARALSQVNVVHPWGRLSVDPRCLVTTPYQQAMNRLRELARGADRHGSCGMGIGETVEDELLGRPVVRIGQLGRYYELRDTLEAIRREKLKAAEALGAFTVGPYFDLLKSSKMSVEYARRYQTIAGVLAMRADADIIDTAEGSVVFEGAQGALLDQDCGFAPHTTWSKTSAQNALSLIAELSRDLDTQVIGVIRAYATRHGAGPFPTERVMGDVNADDHNQANEWQGDFRVGAFDAPMLRYALAINSDTVTSLAVTHMDKVHDNWPVVSEYEGFGPTATLTQAVAGAVPVFTHMLATAFVRFVETQAGIPISLTSWGQTAAAKRPHLHVPVARL
jgi:adenylosuccinate synthase